MTKSMSVYWPGKTVNGLMNNNGVGPGQKTSLKEDHAKPKDGDGVRFEGSQAHVQG